MLRAAEVVEQRLALVIRFISDYDYECANTRKSEISG